MEKILYLYLCEFLIKAWFMLLEQKHHFIEEGVHLAFMYIGFSLNQYEICGKIRNLPLFSRNKFSFMK